MKLEEIFEKCLKLSVGKRQDYVTKPGTDNHENFKRSAEIASWFKNDRDKSYAVLIGTKLARLGSLLSKDDKPNNESIEDNFSDIINYFALWLERVSERTPEILVYEDHKFVSDGIQHSFCVKCGQHKSRHPVVKEIELLELTDRMLNRGKQE